MISRFRNRCVVPLNIYNMRDDLADDDTNDMTKKIIVAQGKKE